MRGTGVYGGRAPQPVADPGELSREMDRIQAERDEYPADYAATPAGDWDAQGEAHGVAGPPRRKRGPRSTAKDRPRTRSGLT